jgi:hypothetical protein
MLTTTPGKSPSLQKPPIKSKSTLKPTFILLLIASILAPTVPLHAQGHPPPAATESPAATSRCRHSTPALFFSRVFPRAEL